MSTKEQVLLCGAYAELSFTGYLQSRICVPETHTWSKPSSVTKDGRETRKEWAGKAEKERK